MSMRAGRLNTRITIEQPSESRSATGAVVTTWSTLATVWAEVVPLRGREFYAAQAVQAETDVKYRIRWRDDVTPKMRINASGVLHDIRAVFDAANERAGIAPRELLEITAKAGVIR